MDHEHTDSDMAENLFFNLWNLIKGKIPDQKEKHRIWGAENGNKYI
jgi:hypothetical protein